MNEDLDRQPRPVISVRLGGENVAHVLAARQGEQPRLPIELPVYLVYAMTRPEHMQHDRGVDVAPLQ